MSDVCYVWLLPQLSTRDLTPSTTCTINSMYHQSHTIIPMLIMNSIVHPLAQEQECNM